jgi:hypothetical protein
MSTAEQRWDHDRDLRKADWRQGDPPSLSPDPLPLRFTAPIATALEIAVLAKSVSVTQAASLIEQYAKTYASGAVLEAVELTSSRMLAAIESPLTRKEPA